MQGAKCRHNYPMSSASKSFILSDNVLNIQISLYALWFCALTSDALCSNWDKEDDQIWVPVLLARSGIVELGKRTLHLISQKG